MNFDRLDSFLESLPDASIPGGELTVMKNGEEKYHKVFGLKDTSQKIPASENDIYWLYSASKVVTCVCALQLLEAGKISLSDPVSKYLPAYGKLTVRQSDGTVSEAKNAMTVEHLFTMSGGLTYDRDTPSILGSRDKSTLGLVNAMALDPLAAEPGESFIYSLCHDVLGAVIEVASGMLLRDYMKKYLFDPLEIKDMGFHPTREQKKRFVPLYSFYNGKGESYIAKNQNNTFVLSDDYDSGGAGLFGTCRDYSKIITALSLGGTAKNGYRVLKEETVKLAEENRISGKLLEDFSIHGKLGYGFGLCCRVHMKPAHSMIRSSLGEFGWDSAGGAYCLIDRPKEISIFYLQHVLDCTVAYRKIHPAIVNLVYDALGL